MPPRTQTGIDADALQADVMRFMAIIAFCLIAILALVRNADPAPAPSAAKVTASAVTKSATVQTVPAQASTLEPKPTPKPELRSGTQSESEPGVAAYRPIAPANTPQQPAIVHAEPENLPASHARQAVPAAQTEPVTDADEGLSLRFESDSDFLRLISKRAIQVYLFNERSAYQLSADYRFVNARPPKQLYEVLPATIPRAISSAADAQAPTDPSLRWGLQLPERTALQIADHIAAQQAGELVINRFGQVRYVATH